MHRNTHTHHRRASRTVRCCTWEEFFVRPMLSFSFVSGRENVTWKAAFLLYHRLKKKKPAPPDFVSFPRPSTRLTWSGSVASAGCLKDLRKYWESKMPSISSSTVSIGHLWWNSSTQVLLTHLRWSLLNQMLKILVLWVTFLFCIKIKFML